MDSRQVANHEKTSMRVRHEMLANDRAAPNEVASRQGMESCDTPMHAGNIWETNYELGNYLNYELGNG